MTPLQTTATVAMSVLGFVTLWLVVTAMVSFIGGWTRLASEFRAEPNTTPSRVRLGRAQMRFGTGYGNVIGLDCQTLGLSLSVLAIFRFRHPPLLIPWDQIESRQYDSFWIFPTTTLLLGRDAKIPLTFYRREARELVARYIQPQAGLTSVR
jgi:hypothetical protein